jgi:hypothetical protein
MTTLIGLAIISVLGGIPAYVIGQRRAVLNTWVAFIPLVGPPIVLLWSINRTAWLALMFAIPLVNLAFAIWLLFAVPRNHARSLLWGLGLLLPFGIYVYALTLPQIHKTHGFTRTVVR